LDSFLALDCVNDLNITILDNCSDFDVHSELFYLNTENFKIIRNDFNLGSNGNFTKALNMATKEYLMVFHDDDCISPDLLNAQIFLFKTYPNLGFVVTGVELVDDIEKLVPTQINTNKIEFDYYSRHGDILDLFFSKNILGFSSIMYSTNLIKKHYDYSEQYGQVGDRALMLNLSMQSSFVHLKNPTYNAFQHNSQESFIRGWSFDLDIKLINLYINSSLISKKYYLLNNIYIWSSQLYSMRKPLPSFIKSINDIQFNNFRGKIIFVLFIPFYFIRSRVVSLLKMDYPNLYKFVIKIKKINS
jgi:hypothetical protein